jgi:hypothetical protein
MPERVFLEVSPERIGGNVFNDGKPVLIDSGPTGSGARTNGDAINGRRVRVRQTGRRAMLEVLAVFVQ